VSGLSIPLDALAGKNGSALGSGPTSKVLNLVNPFGKSEKVAKLAEYALHVGLIAVVCVVATAQLVLAGLQLSWEQLRLLIGSSLRGLRRGFALILNLLSEFLRA
jgi:Flp pilus assembly pilin Flp